MSFSLITRVKPNYCLKDIISALFTKESSNDQRTQCKNFFKDYYNGEAVCLIPSARDGIYELLIRLPQKKVIIPAYTCIAVVEAVRLACKEIVFASTDMSTFNSEYTELITSDCIVLATHQYGLPCNIIAIFEKCKEVGAVLIEDCATSIGTMVDGQLIGTFGDYAVVSFNASKMLTVPPFGGLLVGKNEQMIQDIEKTSEWKNGGISFKMNGLFRALVYILTENHFVYKCFHWLTIDRKGKLQRTEHENPSKVKTDMYKIRFSEWQAVFLMNQLKKLDDIIKRRKNIYAYYDKNIHNPLLKKPIFNENYVCCRYGVLVENRKSFYKACVQKGIDMDFSHCNICCPNCFVEEHEGSKHILNLPFYYKLSDKEMKKVVDVVNSITINS